MRRFMLMYDRKNSWLDRKLKLWRFYFCVKSEIIAWFNKDRRCSILIVLCGVLMLFYAICTVRLYF